MKVSRVIFHPEGCCRGSLLATCSVILDECLRLNNIRLYSNKSSGEKYLVLPSKQDVYRNIKELNPNKNITFPENSVSCKNKKYEEYFNPVEISMYRELLNTIVEGYKNFTDTGKTSYRP